MLGVREADRLDVLDTEYEVVRHRLQQVRLVLQGQALLHIATEDGKGVQRPVNLRWNSGFEGEDKALGLGQSVSQADGKRLREL